jgi:hypothetical protein
MGEKGQWADFAAFMSAVSAARVECLGLSVSYNSPTQGHISFGWNDDLRVAGAVVPLHDYDRFDNPYCRCAFAAPEMVIRRGDDERRLLFPPNLPGEAPA